MTARLERTPQIRHDEDVHREFQSQTKWRILKMPWSGDGGSRRAVLGAIRTTRALGNTWPVTMHITFARRTFPSEL
jgi:hypothetical protein